MKPERVDVDCRQGTRDIINRAMQRDSRIRSKAQFVDEAIWKYAEELLKPKITFRPEASPPWAPPSPRN